MKGCEVDGTNTGSCEMAVFDRYTSNAEHFCCATTALVGC
jgi:hypothetical protein